MILEIPDFLTPDEVARLIALSHDIKFISGRASNPANDTKNNLQAEVSDAKSQEASKIVMAAYMRSREFRDFAFPKHMAPPMLCRYEPQMKYGVHADAPHIVIGSSMAQFRSDLSSTVFIADPATYQGGELVFHLGTYPAAVKGAAGSAVVYPSTTLHEVRPVTAGARLVAITFIESQIRQEFNRTQLYELNEIATREGLKMNWQNRVRLENVRANLTRMWAE